MLLAGNFNLTNTSAIFNELVASGHHPNSRQDSEILLLHLGHYLEKMLEPRGGHEPMLDIFELLKQAAVHWDGGFTLCGLFGHGDAFALRDAAGIRPGITISMMRSRLSLRSVRRFRLQSIFRVRK